MSPLLRNTVCGVVAALLTQGFVFSQDLGVFEGRNDIGGPGKSGMVADRALGAGLPGGLGTGGGRSAAGAASRRALIASYSAVVSGSGSTPTSCSRSRARRSQSTPTAHSAVLSWRRGSRISGFTIYAIPLRATSR